MSPVRRPQQTRSRKTLARLLDAAERLLEDRTFDELSVQDVVAEASSSVGSFYARFPQKEALREALLRRYVDDLLASADDLVARRDTLSCMADRVQLFVEAQVAFCAARRGLMRMRLLYVVDAHAEDGSDALYPRVREFFAPSMHEIDADDPAAALGFALRLSESLVTHTLLLPGAESGGSDLDHTVVRELTRALTAYLGVKA